MNLLSQLGLAPRGQRRVKRNKKASLRRKVSVVQQAKAAYRPGLASAQGVFQGFLGMRRTGTRRGLISFSEAGVARSPGVKKLKQRRFWGMGLPQARVAAGVEKKQILMLGPRVPIVPGRRLPNLGRESRAAVLEPVRQVQQPVTVVEGPSARTRPHGFLDVLRSVRLGGGRAVEQKQAEEVHLPVGLEEIKGFIQNPQEAVLRNATSLLRGELNQAGMGVLTQLCNTKALKFIISLFMGALYLAYWLGRKTG